MGNHINRDGSKATHRIGFRNSATLGSDLAVQLRLIQMNRRPRRLAFALVLLASACGSGNKVTGPSSDNPYNLGTGRAVLTASPIDPASVFAASPLGKLGPPDHTLPTDHVYITFVNAFDGNQANNDCVTRRPIYAAGAGVVTFILATEARGDTKVDVQMTTTFHYYYDHVLLLPGIARGTMVTAGQQIGTTAGCPSFDMGAYDSTVTLSGLVNPARYGPSTRYVVSPYLYFSDSLRALYISRSRVFEGVPINPDGRTDYGVAGRLVGDWFHASLPVDTNSSGSPAGWAKSIAFAYDWYNGTPRISVGGTIAPPFVGSIGSGDPDPATVSVSTGLVAYQVKLPGAFESYGWLLVQMTAADRIRVEFFPGSSRPAALTSGAQEYLR